jgi:2'-5' RNA ligase
VVRAFSLLSPARAHPRWSPRLIDGCGGIIALHAMRLFTAILLPDNVRAHLAGLCDDWRERNRSAVSWVREENLHVTLKFFGEVPDAQVKPLCDDLAMIPRLGTLHLQPDRIECLPPRGPVRIVAAGLTGSLDRLTQLCSEIERRSASLGFPVQHRQYRPHITIARAKRPLPRHERDELIRSGAAGMPGPSFEATGWALMNSKLDRTGAEYTAIARFPAFGQTSPEAP